ncbi:MAG: type I methionyl aminopeptidase [Gemmatimonadaceae bacterium]|nr:type I methionyl aminopeptidase [Gemmatimonadaceae bacterium]NUO94139.1 type I methionyl aminopeptidase [Gemmatimonadaceae bacterium]NUP72018.1 type I methionyl aminopeptidase [Gemmatimonadaceae bacterium]NUR34361.1 type I methionyl aminopeptidase [Gemmatimonadaceae bacterium]NUS33055.1 type I methionyl aminopeptidase [Gemmatimonadaceae bacterium]
MIQLKSAREIELMAEGGRILAAAVQRVREAVRPGVSTLELDAVAEEFIRSHPGATPAFKGLYGFTGSICASINQEIVHGIPSKKRVLEQGDIISIDVGVAYRGYFTDSATTVPVGAVDPETARLLEVTERSLAAGIAAAVPGNHLGDIGAAVQQVVEGAGFSVVRDLVGHGIGVEFHEEPQVPNYGKPKRGLKLVPGLTIAIEPMVNVGGPMTRTLPDKWTIVTVDGSRSAHFEHTVAITENGNRVLTAA